MLREFTDYLSDFRTQFAFVSGMILNFNEDPISSELNPFLSGILPLRIENGVATNIQGYESPSVKISSADGSTFLLEVIPYKKLSQDQQASIRSLFGLPQAPDEAAIGENFFTTLTVRKNGGPHLTCGDTLEEAVSTILSLVVKYASEAMMENDVPCEGLPC